MNSNAIRTPGARKQGLRWLPSSAVGWVAVVVAGVAVVFALVFPSVMSPLSERLHDTPFRRMTGGREMLSFAVTLGVVAAVFGLRALVVARDRAVLVWVAVVPSLLMTVFWLLFALGEVLSPH